MAGSPRDGWDVGSVGVIHRPPHVEGGLSGWLVDLPHGKTGKTSHEAQGVDSYRRHSDKEATSDVLMSLDEDYWGLLLWSTHNNLLRGV